MDLDLSKIDPQTGIPKNKFVLPQTFCSGGADPWDLPIISKIPNFSTVSIYCFHNLKRLFFPKVLFWHDILYKIFSGPLSASQTWGSKCNLASCPELQGPGTSQAQTTMPANSITTSPNVSTSLLSCPLRKVKTCSHDSCFNQSISPILHFFHPNGHTMYSCSWVSFKLSLVQCRTWLIKSLLENQQQPGCHEIWSDTRNFTHTLEYHLLRQQECHLPGASVIHLPHWHSCCAVLKDKLHFYLEIFISNRHAVLFFQIQHFKSRVYKTATY